MNTGKTPSDFHAWRTGEFRRKDIQADKAYKRLTFRKFNGPEPPLPVAALKIIFIALKIANDKSDMTKSLNCHAGS